MDSVHRAEVDGYMAACVQCGTCDDVCPSNRHGGCTPSLVMAGKEGNVRACIGCGRCTAACGSTKPHLVLMMMKADQLGLSPPEVFRQCGYVTSPCEPRFSDGIPELEDGDEVYIMPGCVAKRRVPFVVYAARRALQHIGVGNAELPGNTCCTYPLVFKLEPEESKEELKAAMAGAAGGRDTVTLCGGCTHELRDSGIDFPHITAYFAKYLDRIRALPGAGLKVSMEPGCSVEEYSEQFRAVIEACGCTVVNSTYGCCGKGIPGVQQGLMAEREAESEGADAVVIGCPNCLTAYDTYEGGLPVLHISELVCLAAGDESPLRYHRIKLECE